MVSQSASRRARSQRKEDAPAAGASRRDRILDAAAEEFAARGFHGAKVDRIAARARVNKALLYYYFNNKAALYRETLLDVFRTVASAVMSVHEHGGTAEDQLDRFIQAVADQTSRRPRFPVIWLREMAEGGRHLDESIVLEMKKVLGTLGAILAEGQRAGIFREANPFVVQMSIVAPLLLFSATTPVRERFRHLAPKTPVTIPREVVVNHVRTAALAALRAPESSTSHRSTSRRRSAS